MISHTRVGFLFTLLSPLLSQSFHLFICFFAQLFFTLFLSPDSFLSGFRHHHTCLPLGCFPRVRIIVTVVRICVRRRLITIVIGLFGGRGVSYGKGKRQSDNGKVWCKVAGKHTFSAGQLNQRLEEFYFV
jgi:hypothetical protein